MSRLSDAEFELSLTCQCGCDNHHRQQVMRDTVEAVASKARSEQGEGDTRFYTNERA